MPKESNVIKHGSVSIKINSSTNRGREMFFFNFYEGGRRQQRNFASEGDARAEADIIARRLSAGHGAAIALTGRDRDAYLHALSLTEGIGVPLAVVVEQYVAAYKKLDGEPLADAVDFFLTRNPSKLPSKLVSEAVQEFLAAKEQDQMSQRYIDDCRVRLKRFQGAFTGQIGHIQACEIEDWLRGLKLSAKSRNNFRGVVSTLFSYARSRGYLRKSERTEAELVPKVKERPGRTEIFTPHELSLLLTKALTSRACYALWMREKRDPSMRETAASQW